MTIFILKIVACLTMILDHIKYAIPELNNFVTIYFGRIAFPLFAFLLTEGYVHTSNLKKYYKRLIVFAIISQIPFMLFRTLVGDWKYLNIMFTLLLGLITITAYDKIEKKYISIPICILVIALGEILRVDYGWFGVILIFLLYLFKEKKILLTISYILLITIYYIIRGFDVFYIKHLLYIIFTIVPLILIYLYNGKKGRSIKYFYYLFYPVHMLIFYIISI